MADNLSVNITADATQMRAQLALAQADLRAYAAEVRKAAADVRQSGNAATAEQVQALEKASASYNAARAAVQQHATALATQKSAVNAATVAIKDATIASHNHGAATEAMVLVHEAMSGRFSKMGGSLMILTQRLGGASMAMMALGGAAGVTAMGLMHVVEWMDKVSAAKLLAEAGGLGSELTMRDADAAVVALKKQSTITTEEAGKIANAYTSMAGITAPVLIKLTQVTEQFAQRSGESATSASAKIVSAYQLNSAAASEVMAKTRATTETVLALQDAIARDDRVTARKILLNQLAASATLVDTETRKATRTTTELNAAMAAANNANMPKGSASAAMLKTPIVDTAQVENAKTLAAALASVNDKVDSPKLQSWAQSTEEALRNLVYSTKETAHAHGENWQKANELATDATVKFWQAQVAQTTEGSENRKQANQKLQAALEAQDTAHWKIDTAGAKQALHEQLTALTEQQAAHHDDFQVVMQIEDQKIALLRGAGKEYTAELNRELTARENLIREHATKVAGIDLETIKKNIENDRTRLETMRANLAAEVSDYQITKQAELRELMAASQADYEQEQFDLHNFMAAHQSETDVLRKALEDQAVLKEQHERAMAALRAQVAAADRADQQRTLNSYQQMFQGVGSASKSAIEGMITGSMTWQKAEQNVAHAVVNSAVNLGTEVVAKWAAVELAKTMISDKAVLQRVVAEQQDGQSGWGAILASWLGLETAKTGATDANVAARLAAEMEAGITGRVAASAQGVAQITSDAAVAGAGAYAATAPIPYVGPAMAPAAAATASAAVMAMAPMASFAVGAWDLPHDMIAQVHEGETIIPAGPAAAFRAAMSGSGSSGASTPAGADVHLHVHAVDAGSVAALFRSNGADLARVVAHQLNNNPSLRPRY